jgi:hypothetical protein
VGGGFLNNRHPPPQTISEGGNAELFQMRGPCRLNGEVTIGMFGEPGDHMRRQRPFAGFSARPSRALDRRRGSPHRGPDRRALVDLSTGGRQHVALSRSLGECVLVVSIICRGVFMQLVHVKLRPRHLEILNQWRSLQRVPNCSESIRRLIELGAARTVPASVPAQPEQSPEAPQ